MFSTTSTVTPLIIPTVSNHGTSDYVRTVYEDGSISYEKNLHRQQPVTIHRSYTRPKYSKNRYLLQQVYLINIACFSLLRVL